MSLDLEMSLDNECDEDAYALAYTIDYRDDSSAVGPSAFRCWPRLFTKESRGLDTECIRPNLLFDFKVCDQRKMIRGD